MRIFAIGRTVLFCGVLAGGVGACPVLAQGEEPEPTKQTQQAPPQPADPATALGAEVAAPAAAAADSAAVPAEPAEQLPWAPPPPIRVVAPAAPHKASPYHSMKLTEKAKQTYAAEYGIDGLKVTYTSSGNLIRFSYRVLDPARAKGLSDKKLTPYLLGQKSHAMLSVPVMEKIGPLRQAAAPEAGQEYWMVFSNKGQPIKPGDRVNVMIGSFHADGLLVE